MTPSLLSDVDTTTVPLSDQLARAASQLAALHTAGEFAPLAPYVRTEIAGLAMFLLGAADRARGLEHAAVLRRVRRVRSIGDVVRRMGGRA